MKIKVLIDLKDSDDNFTLVEAGEILDVDYQDENGDFITTENILVGFEEAEIIT